MHIYKHKCIHTLEYFLLVRSSNTSYVLVRSRWLVLVLEILGINKYIIMKRDIVSFEVVVRQLSLDNFDRNNDSSLQIAIALLF